MMGSWRIKRLAWRYLPRNIILRYHRISDPICDPHRLCVRPCHFEEQMSVLRNLLDPIPLIEMMQARRLHAWSGNRVAITFDDGYLDNLKYAVPILAKYSIPATVFIVPGRLGHQKGFWWDELGHLVLDALQVPPKLNFQFWGRDFSWDRRGNPTGNQQASQSLHKALYEFMRPLPADEQDRLLEKLKVLLVDHIYEGSAQILSAGDVLHMDQHGLVEIGAHTMTHPVLSGLTRESQRMEIESGRHCLEQILGHPVKGFAYPYGTGSDYTAETVSCVKEMKFKYACTVVDDFVWWGSDPMQLPRILVQDWDGAEFERRVITCMNRKQA